VALARALVIRPRCLLLDEPLSNLDAKLRLEMRMEIRRICKEHGLTAIYVTHEQKEALSMADRLAVLNQGKIQQIGSPVEMYRAPVSRFVSDFMGETNFLSGTVQEVSSGISVKTSLGIFETALSPHGFRPKPGEVCTLSIRPESWKLTDSPALTNSVAGKIQDCVYLGETAQYRFVAAGGDLKIYEFNPRFVAHDGDREVFASVAPEDVVLLPN
jgi:iron(III) transport system ATP-binding protein